MDVNEHGMLSVLDKHQSKDATLSLVHFNCEKKCFLNTLGLTFENETVSRLF